MRAVEDGSPAAAAGIEAGDLLAAANGAELATGRRPLRGARLPSRSGGSLELTVVRGTEERPVKVEFEASGAAA